MAITSEIIGKLGGADVEAIPVEGKTSGRTDTSEVLATIDVPAGETWLVAAIGQVTTASSVLTSCPQLKLGGEVSVIAERGTRGIATTAAEPISLYIKRNNSSGTDSFTGHVYTVKM